MIYLDHNATTPMDKRVQELLIELLPLPLNASSVHFNGRRARSMVEEARANIANLLNIDLKNYQVIFTSSGTEANNLIINNFKDADIFVSAIEHLSILECKNYNPNISVIKVDENGMISLGDLTHKLSLSNNPNKLISVMLVNNETGIIQPLEEISKIAKNFGAKLHSDIVQAVGKLEINIKELGVDFATLSAHKFGGPIGVGALVANLKFPLKAMIIGGGQERGIRSGTENVLAVAGAGLAAKLAQQELNARMNHMLFLRNRLEQNLPLDWKIIGKASPRLCNTSMLVASGIRSESLMIRLDLQGYYVSHGSACSSGKAKKSYVLEAMNLRAEDKESAIRVSLSHNNSEKEIDLFIKEMWEFCNIYNNKKIA